MTKRTLADAPASGGRTETGGEDDPLAARETRVGDLPGPRHVPAAEGGRGHVGPIHAVPRCRGCRAADRAIRDTLAFIAW